VWLPRTSRDAADRDRRGRHQARSWVSSIWSTADCLAVAVDLADSVPARAVGLDIPELIKPEVEITQRRLELAPPATWLSAVFALRLRR
jgi:hypothetical protein